MNFIGKIRPFQSVLLEIGPNITSFIILPPSAIAGFTSESSMGLGCAIVFQIRIVGLKLGINIGLGSIP